MTNKKHQIETSQENVIVKSRMAHFFQRNMHPMYWIGNKVSLFGGYPTILGGEGRVSRNRSLSPPLSYTANNNIYLIEISPIYPTCYTQLLGFFVLRKEHLNQLGVVPETRKAEVITHRPLPLLLLSFHPVLIISTKGFSPFANITNS